MSEWVFEGTNPITNYTLGVELTASIAPARLREIAASHPKFRRDLPRKTEQPMLTFQMATLPGVQPQAQLGNVTFDSVREDGTVARALIIGPTQIAYMTASYSRWEEFEPVATRHIREIAIDLLRKWPDSLPRARSQPVLAVALHIQQASNPDSMLTIPAMIDVFVRCVRRGFLNGSDTIRNRLTCPILCSTRTRNRLSPLLYSFSSSVSWPPFGFLYG